MGHHPLYTEYKKVMAFKTSVASRSATTRRATPSAMTTHPQARLLLANLPMGYSDSYRRTEQQAYQLTIQGQKAPSWWQDLPNTSWWTADDHVKRDQTR